MKSTTDRMPLPQTKIKILVRTNQLYYESFLSLFFSPDSDLTPTPNQKTPHVVHFSSFMYVHSFILAGQLSTDKNLQPR